MMHKNIVLYVVIGLLCECFYGCQYKNTNNQSNIEIVDHFMYEKLKKLDSYSPLESRIFVVKFQNHFGEELVTFSNLKCLNLEEQYSGYLLLEGDTIIIQDTSKFGSNYYNSYELIRNIPDDIWCSEYVFDSTFSLLYLKIDTVFYRYGASLNFAKLNIQINDSTENPDFLF